MIVIDGIILFILLKLGFKLIERIKQYYPFFPVKLFKWLLLYHSFFSLFFWFFSLNNPADAIAYYYSSIFSLLPGTNFIKSITYLLSDIIPLSYLSTFWVFGFIGFLFLPIFYIAIRENMILSGRLLQLLHCVLFLPGLSFWTSAIGKDGLMMVGISSFMFSLNHMSNVKNGLFLACA